MKRYEGFYTAASTRESSSNGIEDGETSKFDSPRSEILPSLSLIVSTGNTFGVLVVMESFNIIRHATLSCVKHILL